MAFSFIDAYLYMLWFRFTSVILIIYFSFSCGNKNARNHTRTVFNYNEINGITSLDPAAATNTEDIWAVNQLYNGLVQMDDSLNVKPAIAHNFSISTNGLEYTFYLRNDVYFHDNVCFDGGKGRKVVAKDFEFTFSRLYDTRVSSATSLLTKIDRSAKRNLKGFEALNDSVFKVYLNTPFSAFINILSMKYFSVIPSEAVNYYKDDFRRNPVGTGPFMYKSWDEGTKLILLKNPKYFETDNSGKNLPYLDAVTVSFIRDRETAFMEFLNGRFDMLSGADAFNTNEVLDKEARLRDIYTKKFSLQKETFLKTDYIGILIDEQAPLVKNSPVKFRAIRQAINYGFDRKKLVRYLRNSIGVPGTAGFIPKGMKSFDTSVVKGYNYNPAKVRELLSSAGFPNGKGLPELTLHVSDNYKEQVEFIQSQLAMNNIKVQVSIEKAAVLRQAVNRGEYLLFKKSWVADYADEENFMSLFYSKHFSPNGVNYFHYRNAAFDRLFELALNEKNPSVKKKLYQEMDQMVTNDAPFIVLYYDELVRLVSHTVKGLTPNPMNLLDLKRVRKTTGS